MTARPLFGISCCTRSFDAETGQAVMTRYVDAAMRYADADAVLIPALPELTDARSLMRRLDGLLLTGSVSNVDPRRYGGNRGDGPFDHARDEVVLSLIDAATAAGRPVLGICRGLQEINVAFGGTLRDDVGTAAPPHHASPGTDFAAMFAHCHHVLFMPGGLLARAVGREGSCVNSVHFQGVDQLGDGLAVEARSDDGIVEAFSATVGNAPVVAVQWHPEWDARRNPDSQAVFALFGQMLRSAHAAPTPA